MHLQNIPAAIRQLDRTEAEDRLKDGFKNMDARILAELTDKQLAVLQAEVLRDSPQFIRAEHEWQRRLVVRQLRTSHIIAWVGVAASILGVLIGWLLSK